MGMLLDLDESKRLPGIKVSGTLKLRSRDPLMDNLYEKNDMKEIGCFPNWMASVWSNLFDWNDKLYSINICVTLDCAPFCIVHQNTTKNITSGVHCAQLASLIMYGQTMM